MLKTKFIRILFIFFIFLLSINSHAQAQNSSVQTQSTITNCQKVSSNLTLELERLSQKNSIYFPTLNGLWQEITDLLKILDSNRVNKDQINQILTQFKDKVNTFEVEIKSHISEIDSLSRKTCQISETEFNSNLEEIRLDRANIANKAEEIETIVKNDLKNELIKIRGKYRLN
jgi:hypothetical protein